MIQGRQLLIYLSVKYKGDWQSIYNAVRRQENVNLEEVASMEPRKAITILDEDYPQCLKAQFHPPFVIYYKGNRRLINNRHKLGVIGSRKMTVYGKEVTDHFLDKISESKEDITIVSGMALGIDGEASREAMKHEIPLISIVGSGLDICYPSNNKDIYEYCQTDKGLILSEYPDGVEPFKENFPPRNRIIAAVCDSLLVVEAGPRSGTSITVNFTTDIGKEVLAVPTSIFSKSNFTNFLIESGATPCLDFRDILDSLKKSEK